MRKGAGKVVWIRPHRPHSSFALLRGLAPDLFQVQYGGTLFFEWRGKAGRLCPIDRYVLGYYRVATVDVEPFNGVRPCF